MSPEQIDQRLTLARQLAFDAGAMIIEFRNQQVHWDYKQGVELVTTADKAVDKMISERIQAAFPSDLIMAEESNPDVQLAQQQQPALWVIDPIDGTVNFARGHFQVAVSIAFAIEGEVQFGVIYCPFYQELFTARRGKGAMLNDQPIQPSTTLVLNRALIATGFPYQKHRIELLQRQLEPVLQQCADVRRIGSAAIDICWVAMGRLDGYYESLSPWDFAAAVLIAREAGANCGHLYPVPKQQSPELYGEHILVANPKLYQPLKQLIVNAVPNPELYVQ